MPKPVDQAPPPICNAQAGANTGQPIIPSTGEKHLHETDFADSSAHPLNVRRSYMSQLASKTPFGNRWTWNHQMALRIDYTQVPTLAALHMPDGSVRNFRNKTGNWNSYSPGTLTLSINPSGAQEHTYQPMASDNKYVFNAQGQLIRQIERNGWAYSYTHNAAGKLISITNQFGRSLQLGYNAAGLVSQIIPPDGQPINYQYDSAERLVFAGFPENSLKKYHYESPANDLLLTGVTDENNIRLSTYSYNSQGKAIETTKAQGIYRFQITYPQIGSTQTLIVDPLGTTRSYQYSTQLSQLAVTGADKPSGQGMPDAASRVQSALGLIEQETDFLGFTIQYQWDTARRLPTSLTRAVGRPEAQTFSTQWHPAISMPARITEQGKTTAYTYDAAGNILQQTETDTTGNASNGQTRTWAFSYSPQNLPLTMTEPRGQVWTFTYDAGGNRASIINPLGHLSSYTYDAAGRVLTETAPNGLITSYQYDLRGRVTRVTRGSNLIAAQQQITVYTYRPSGQIATAALPNGQAISYTYDDAQRLIGATDNRGNSIAYTLDPMGNRTQETTKDASNQIAYATSRVINSLNRVESIKGGTNPSAQITAFQYDANGELIQSTDPLGNITKTGLDALRRPTATTTSALTNPIKVGTRRMIRLGWRGDGIGLAMLRGIR